MLLKMENRQKAAEGFARSQGVDINDLIVKTLGDAEYLFAHKFVKGCPQKMY